MYGPRIAQETGYDAFYQLRGSRPSHASTLYNRGIGFDSLRPRGLSAPGTPEIWRDRDFLERLKNLKPTPPVTSPFVTATGQRYSPLYGLGDPTIPDTPAWAAAEYQRERRRGQPPDRSPKLTPAQQVEYMMKLKELRKLEALAKAGYPEGGLKEKPPVRPGSPPPGTGFEAYRAGNYPPMPLPNIPLSATPPKPGTPPEVDAILRATMSMPNLFQAASTTPQRPTSAASSTPDPPIRRPPSPPPAYQVREAEAAKAKAAAEARRNPSPPSSTASSVPLRNSVSPPPSYSSPAIPASVPQHSSVSRSTPASRPSSVSSAAQLERPTSSSSSAQILRPSVAASSSASIPRPSAVAPAAQAPRPSAVAPTAQRMSTRAPTRLPQPLAGPPRIPTPPTAITPPPPPRIPTPLTSIPTSPPPARTPTPPPKVSISNFDAPSRPATPDNASRPFRQASGYPSLVHPQPKKPENWTPPPTKTPPPEEVFIPCLKNPPPRLDPNYGKRSSASPAAGSRSSSPWSASAYARPNPYHQSPPPAFVTPSPVLAPLPGQFDRYGHDHKLPDNHRGITIRHTGLVTTRGGAYQGATGPLLLEIGYRLTGTANAVTVWVEEDGVMNPGREDEAKLARYIWDKALASLIIFIKYQRFITPTFELGSQLVWLIDGRKPASRDDVRHYRHKFTSQCRKHAEITQTHLAPAVDELVKACRYVNESYIRKRKPYPEGLRKIMFYMETIQPKVTELAEAWTSEAEDEHTLKIELRSLQDPRWRPLMDKRVEGWYHPWCSLKKQDNHILSCLIAFSNKVKELRLVSTTSSERQMEEIRQAFPVDKQGNRYMPEPFVPPR